VGRPGEPRVPHPDCIRGLSRPGVQRLAPRLPGRPRWHGSGPGGATWRLSLKAKYPRSVLVLRGNHGDPEVNKRYGFLRSSGLSLGFTPAFSTIPLSPLLCEYALVARLEVGGRRARPSVKTSPPSRRPRPLGSSRWRGARRTPYS